MTDASIIVALISLVASAVTVAAGIYFKWYSDQHKEVAKDEKALAKYRYPILRAAQDLQLRLFNIAETDLLSWNVTGTSDPRKVNLVQYTCFLVGQYLAWTYILYQQPHFLYLMTSKKNTKLIQTMDDIHWILNTPGYDSSELERPFYLWRGHQFAIGEIMTSKMGDEDVCMGYARFHTTYNADPKFKEWFQSLEEGITAMADGYSSVPPLVPDYRVRRLQHGLVELVKMLESDNAQPLTPWSKFCRILGLEEEPCYRMYRGTLCEAAPMCRCTKCSLVETT